ncbi:phage assembly protein [Sedimentisphaera cyanobacteriorum]|uniref:Phage assembly protein n=1 Tax=Sedimentisphaera cyanobacteriorum TaxID=1940790 RepID=A0A1Q2HP85_9BACT|nr:hypothetical protein [Sedimentisphaera cyanobacteriorum]AQQ09262.1 phage assembly protein [Sedimentisphaera cyanobacteriorum]
MTSRLIFILSAAIFITGCGSEGFITDDATEFEAKVLLEEASRIEADSSVKNHLPDIYEQEPKIIETSSGTKVVYFTKNQPPNVLAGLLKNQLKCSANPSSTTNQIIISCKNKAQAEEAISFLNSVDVLPVQIKISCMLIEHYADLTMDRETTVHIGELFGTDITLSGKQKGGKYSDYLPNFPGALLREPDRADLSLDLGFEDGNIGDTDFVRVVVDMLESRGYLKVMMNPELEVVSGQKATFKSREQVPTIRVITERNRDPYNLTEYIWVEDYLEVVPHLYADGTIGIKTKVLMGSKSTPEGVVQQRIISRKGIDIGENRVKPGQSLIIGGFKKAEKVSVIRGFPFLKDIPAVGLLFSSKDFEERAKEITFIITPSISSHGEPYDEMLKKVRAQLDDHVTDSEITRIIERMMIDPFQNEMHKREVKSRKDEEELKKVKAEINLANRSRELKKLRNQLNELKRRLEFEKSQASNAQKSAEEYQKEIEKVEKITEKLEKTINPDKKQNSKQGGKK